MALTAALRPHGRLRPFRDALWHSLRRQQAWSDVERLGTLVADGLCFLAPAIAFAPPAIDHALVIDADGCRLGTIVPDGRVNASGPAFPAEDLDRHLAAWKQRTEQGRKPAIGLLLADPITLPFRLDLPYAPLEAVPAMVREALIARSPFGADATWLHLRLYPGEGRKLAVDVMMAEAALPRQALAVLEAHGLAPLACGLLAEDGNHLAWHSAMAGGLSLPQVLGLLGARHARTLRRLARLLALLAAIAIVSGAWNTLQLAEARSERQRAESQFRRVAQVAGDAALVVDHRQATRRTAMILDQLAGKLPSNVWLESLKISRSEIEMSIAAPVLSEALAGLSAMPALSGAQLRSPISREGQDGLERARVGARLTGAATRGTGGRP